MTQDEKDALLGYLEFNLVQMVENLDKRIVPEHREFIMMDLYDQAYEVLHEMERTLEAQQEINRADAVKKTS